MPGAGDAPLQVAGARVDGAAVAVPAGPSDRPAAHLPLLRGAHHTPHPDARRARRAPALRAPPRHRRRGRVRQLGGRRVPAVVRGDHGDHAHDRACPARRAGRARRGRPRGGHGPMGALRLGDHVGDGRHGAHGRGPGGLADRRGRRRGPDAPARGARVRRRGHRPGMGVRGRRPGGLAVGAGRLGRAGTVFHGFRGGLRRPRPGRRDGGRVAAVAEPPGLAGRRRALRGGARVGARRLRARDRRTGGAGGAAPLPPGTAGSGAGRPLRVRQAVARARPAGPDRAPGRSRLRSRGHSSARCRAGCPT